MYSTNGMSLCRLVFDTQSGGTSIPFGTFPQIASGRYCKYFLQQWISALEFGRMTSKKFRKSGFGRKTLRYNSFRRSTVTLSFLFLMITSRCTRESQKTEEPTRSGFFFCAWYHRKNSLLSILPGMKWIILYVLQVGKIGLLDSFWNVCFAQVVLVNKMLRIRNILLDIFRGLQGLEPVTSPPCRGTRPGQNHNSFISEETKKIRFSTLTHKTAF